jgi:hypothetical protein
MSKTQSTNATPSEWLLSKLPVKVIKSTAARADKHTNKNKRNGTRVSLSELLPRIPLLHTAHDSHHECSLLPVPELGRLLQGCMDYYYCSIEELHQELQRRNYTPVGNRDQLSESLRADDDARGSEATTVTTHHPTLSAPREAKSTQTVEFDHTASAMQLVNQSTINCRKDL